MAVKPTRSVTREVNFFENAVPNLVAGAPTEACQAFEMFRFITMKTFKANAAARIVAKACDRQTQYDVGVALSFILAAVLDDAVTKLDALHDNENPRLVTIPRVIRELREQAQWVNLLETDVITFLDNIEKTIAASRKALNALKRYRNDEAAHLAWTSNEFKPFVAEELNEVMIMTYNVVGNLGRLTYPGLNFRSRKERTSALAEIFANQVAPR